MKTCATGFGLLHDAADQSPFLCKHFKICGGCTSQDLPYQRQLLEKERLILQLFSPLCSQILPILGSDPYFNYRNKMELSFSQTLQGERFLGLRMSGKRGRVFTMEECHLCPGWMMEALKATKDWWEQNEIEAYFPPKNKGALRTLTLREGDQGERMVILTVSGEKLYTIEETQLDLFKEFLIKICSPTSIVLITQIVQEKTPTRFEERLLYGKDHLKVTLGHCRFKVRPLAFFQPNRYTSLMLYQNALDLMNLHEEDILYDLYCGTGTLAIFAAHKVKKVIAVELNSDAVKDARENIVENGCLNVEIYNLDVADLLKTALSDRPHKIIIDPPRTGLSPKAIEYVTSLGAQKIIYISCNPLTQIEDVKKIMESGYILTLVQPIDQFPHTKHIENIAVLEKRV